MSRDLLALQGCTALCWNGAYGVAANLNNIPAATPEYLVYPLRAPWAEGGFAAWDCDSCQTTLSPDLGSTSELPLPFASSAVFVAYFRRLMSLYYGSHERWV